MQAPLHEAVAQMAEGVGFEPTWRFYPPTRFPVVPVKPLPQPSQSSRPAVLATDRYYTKSHALCFWRCLWQVSCKGGDAHSQWESVHDLYSAPGTI